MPIAEESGFIVAIGQWVLREACRQAREWQEAGLVPMRVAINISARDLMDAELPDQVAALLSTQGCAAQWITLEITETRFSTTHRDGGSQGNGGESRAR